MSAAQQKNEDDLLKQTIRMVVVLVGACVLFMAVTSLGAVLFTSRVFASPGADAKPAEPTAAAAKKPLSI